MKRKLPGRIVRLMRTVLTVILALTVLMCSVSACNEEVQKLNIENNFEQGVLYNESVQSIAVNEYEMYKKTLELDMGVESLLRVLAGQNDYVEALRDLTKYTEVELENMGYSAGNISIIEKLRNDSSYVPTDEELTLAAATFRFHIACSDSYVRDARSYYDFIWSFTWVTAPVRKYSDCVAVQWLGDFYMDENAIEAEITYVGSDANGNAVTHVEDYESDMRAAINPADNGCCLEFPAGMYVDDETYVVVDSGSGSFRLRCNEHGHPDISIGWLYAHYSVGIAAVNPQYGNSLPSITISGTFDEMASGSRTYYAN